MEVTERGLVQLDQAGGPDSRRERMKMISSGMIRFGEDDQVLCLTMRGDWVV